MEAHLAYETSYFFGQLKQWALFATDIRFYRLRKENEIEVSIPRKAHDPFVTSHRHCQVQSMSVVISSVVMVKLLVIVYVHGDASLLSPARNRKRSAESTASNVLANVQ